MAQEQGGTASPSSNRRRLFLFGGFALLAIAAAIIAGVLGSSSQKKSKSVSTADHVAVMSSGGGMHDALATANTIAVVTPVLPAGGAVPSTSVPAGSDSSTGTSSGGAKQQDKNNLPLAVPFMEGFKAPGDEDDDEAVCYVGTAAELVTAVTTSSCTFVILTENDYEIKAVMNVTTTKIVIGNPIIRTTIDGGKVNRVFEVFSGGALDVRTVVLVRGHSQRPDPGIRLVVGGTIVVHVGGRCMATGVTFREVEQTVQSFLAEIPEAYTQRQRTLGGHILVLGGNIYLNACVFVSARPFGNPVVSNFAMGRDILVLVGNAVSFGSWHMNTNFFGWSVVVGQVQCVLGGTYNWAGGGIANAIVGQAQGAAGSVLFIGGGVFVLAGVVYGTATLVGMRAYFAQFGVGGGVLFQVGHAVGSAWGAGARFWVGSNYATGMGILRLIGSASGGSTIVECGIGSGGNFFLGYGSMNNQGFARYQTRVTLYNGGNGFGAWNGYGIFHSRQNPSLGLDVARAQYGACSDTAQGYGYGLYLNNSRYNYQVFRIFMGLGNTMWLGYGGGIIYRLVQVSIRQFSYAETPNSFTISGKQYSRALGQPGNNPKRVGWSVWFGKERALQRERRARLLQTAEESAASDDAVSNEPGSMLVDTFVDERVAKPGALKDYLDSLSSERSLDFRTNFANFMKIFQMEDYLEPRKPWGFLVNSTAGVYACNLRPGPTESHYAGDGPVTMQDECAKDTPANMIKLGLDYYKNNPATTVIKDFIANAPEDDGGGRRLEEEKRRMEAELAEKRQEANHRWLQDLKAPLDDTHILWYKMAVSCNKEDIKKDHDFCVNITDIKDAVGAYLGDDEVLELSVTNQKFHKSILPYVTPQLEIAVSPDSSEGAANCFSTEAFDIYLTVSTDDEATDITTKLDLLTKDSQPLRDILTGYKLPVCALTSRHIFKKMFPPMDRMPRFDPRSSGVLGPAVMVYASDSIAPLQSVVAGQTYTVAVVNFVANTAVDVELLGKNNPEPGKQEAAIKIASFPKGGVAEVTWTAPTEPGKYYFHSHPKGLKLPFGTSTVFSVTEEEKFPGRRW